MRPVKNEAPPGGEGMGDVVLVTGVLILRPSEEKEEGGITCDGVLMFKSPAGHERTGPQPAELKNDDETFAGDGIPAGDEGIPAIGDRE